MPEVILQPHVYGTNVPVEEPSTASIADMDFAVFSPLAALLYEYAP
jgi:hypothetical protein